MYNDEILTTAINRPTEKSIFQGENMLLPCVKLAWDDGQTLPNKFGVSVKITKRKKLFHCDLKFLLPTGDKKFHAVGKSPETAIFTAWNFYQAFRTREENHIPHKLDWGLIVTKL